MDWVVTSTRRWLRRSNRRPAIAFPGTVLAPFVLPEIDLPALLETDPSVLWQVVWGVLAVTCLAAIIGAIAAASRSTPEGRPRSAETRPYSPTDGGDGDESYRSLDDEQRVLALLEENGGRARQADVVEWTGWSKAKTSRVVGQMADEGRVKKIPLGRENLVFLPGESPFETAIE